MLISSDLMVTRLEQANSEITSNRRCEFSASTKTDNTKGTLLIKGTLVVNVKRTSLALKKSLTILNGYFLRSTSLRLYFLSKDRKSQDHILICVLIGTIKFLLDNRPMLFHNFFKDALNISIYCPSRYTSWHP